MANGVFIGRVAELHQLDANLRAARAGDFRLVLLVGEAGVGKSRLLAEFLQRADDTRVMTGACLPLESATLPYAPMVDALHELMHGLPAAEIDEVIGPARPELARLLPELETPNDAMSDQQTEPISRARFFDLLLGVLERAARSSVTVLAIEDVHWADPATRDLLRVLVRGLRRTPVLLVLTLRADASPDSASGRHFAAELARFGAVIRIDVPAFDESEVRALTAELSGRQPSAAVVGRLMARSDGIPFVVEQLVITGEHEEDLPPTLADMVGARLSRISPEGRAVLGIVAALGRRVDRTLTAEISGLDPEDVDAALREAIDAGILVRATTERGARYEFRHALVREVVESGLLDTDRQRLHRAAAAALEREAESVDGSGATASEAAYHWEAAEEWDQALAAHLVAGAHARRLYAWGTAMHHYERALRLLERVPTEQLPDGVDRAELLHLAADAAYLAGDFGQALAWGREAIDLVIEADPPRAGALHERLRWYLWDSGDRRGAMASVAEAMRLIPAEPPTKALASVLGQHAAVLMHSGRTEDAANAAAHALEVARRAESIADIGQALGMLGWTRVVRGDIEDGLAAIRQARDTAVMAGDVSGIALGSALLAHMLTWVGRRTEARDVALDAYDRVVELGLQRTYGGTLLGYAVHAFIEEGSWQLADRWVERGLDPEPAGRPAHWLRINRARLLTLRGAFAEAVQELAEADEHEASSGGTEYRDDLVAAYAELNAWRGAAPEGGALTVGDAVEHRRGRRAVPADTDDRGPGHAQTVVDLVLARPPSAPFGPAAAWTIVHALMAEADEAERARAVANGTREAAAVARADALCAHLDAALAVHSYLLASPEWRSLAELAAVEAVRARSQARPEDWERQAAAWSEVGDPFRTAYADYRLGMLLVKIPSRRTVGVERLDAAAATADALGATVLSDRIGLVRSPGRSATPPAEDEVQLERPDRLTIHALGRLQFLRDGVPIRSVGGPKAGRRQAEGLFAFLLDRGPKGITKDEAVEMIWPEQELAAGDLAFHRTLGGLRRVLEPDLESVSASLIGFDHDRYSLDPRAVAWTDFGAFELAMEEARSTPDPFVKASALEEARRLYRGDYFDDCPFFGDSPEVEPTRRRLRADFVDLLVMLAELAEERGDARAAAALYREALESADDDLPIASAGLSRIGQLGAQVRALGA